MKIRNAFCAVRPPGHHAGPRGIVTCPNDSEGSHGFCLLNNVAIGAAYARSMYRNDGIKKVNMQMYVIVFILGNPKSSFVPTY